MDKKQLTEKLYNDCVWYIENNLYIRTKAGTLSKLILNRIQKELVAYVIDCLERGVPIRAIILKARQEGVSTVIEAVLFWYTTTRKHISARIIAHNVESSNNLFGMSKLYFDKLHPFVRPMRKYSNRKELVFDNPSEQERQENPGLDSKIMVSTAGNTQAGRSETNQLLHASEVAFWEHPEEIMAGMLQTVPMLPNTMVYLESTANGVGGYFYDEYQAAKRGDSAFKAFFFPWWVHEEYSMTPPKTFRLTDEEKQVRDSLGLNNSQMYWRRLKKSELERTGGLFEQEYPATDHEAFVTSGRPRFDVPSLKYLLTKVKKPVVGEVEDGKFKPNPKGRLKLWGEPFPDWPYVMGVDVSEGLIKGDNSVIQILDRYTGEQVGEWAGKIDPDMLGEMAFRIGRYFNWALLGVEANNHGLTTLTILRQMAYPRLFFRKILDDKTKKTTTKLGWTTSIKTKPLMIDEMATWIREREIKINSKDLIEECLTYVVDDRGLTNAQQGCLDDRVTSMAIALQMYKFTNIENEEDPKIKFSSAGSRR